MSDTPQHLRILVVDDDKLSRVTTAKKLKGRGHEAADADGPYAGLALLEEQPFDVVLTDLRMPGMDGIEFLAAVREQYPGTEVILMTAYGTVENAVEAMQLGAADFLTKPFQMEELDLRLARLLELKSARAEVERLRGMVADARDTLGLVGSSPGVALIRDRIRRFADHDVPVLVTGETGTGKEVVARALHQLGRQDGAFVAVGCGNIPRELAESEFFGHEKGSFTGATDRRIGAFEKADGGTLLLDDVDDLPPELQVKLLRVLQEGVVVRVGSTEERRVDVRVVATTKVDLEDLAESGGFRPDLFYRLRGLEIHLPPLRERGDDVLMLADHFLQRSASDAGADPKRLTAEAGRLLLGYRWPGNVRELRRAMESAHVLASGELIEPDALPDFLQRARGGSGRFQLDLEGCAEVDLNELLQEFEAAVLRWAMVKADGRQTAAARLLHVPRSTLQSKLQGL